MNLEQVMIRMDKKLREQLQKYADRNDEGNLSLTSRRALKKFVEEQSLLDQQEQFNK